MNEKEYKKCMAINNISDIMILKVQIKINNTKGLVKIFCGVTFPLKGAVLIIKA